MKCILVLAANPQSTDRSELEREAAIIRSQLAIGRHGKDFEVRTEIGVRIFISISTNDRPCGGTGECYR
jgi:hypothetical protein